MEDVNIFAVILKLIKLYAVVNPDGHLTVTATHALISTSVFMPLTVTVSMNVSTHLAHGNADVILVINHVKMTPSRVNQYVLLRVRTTEYVLLLIPASVHPVTLVLNAQLFAFQPVLMEEFANETTFVYVQRDGPVKRAEQRRATHLALTEDVVLPLTNVSVHCHTLVHNVKDLTAVQSVRTEGRVLDVINVLVCKTGVGALVHNGSLRMNVLRRAKTMEHVLETINVIAKLVSMENYVRKRC